MVESQSCLVGVVMSCERLPLTVECYAGHRGEQTPLRFIIDSRNVEVVELLDSWLSPDHRYFKVKGDDDSTYILRHNALTFHWALTHIVPQLML